MIKVLGLALYGPMAASTRQRLEQYVSALAVEGIDLKVHHLLGDDYLRRRFNDQHPPWSSLLRSGWHRLGMLRRSKKYDLAIVYCELFPFAPSWLEHFILPIPYIYDFDDAFYLKYKTGKFAALRPLLGNKFDSLIANAAYVTAGNRALKQFAGERNPNVELLPTVVDTSKYRPLAGKRDNMFTVGWIGSPSTAPYLSQLIGPLSCLGREGPLRLVVVGGQAPTIPGVSVEQMAWKEESEIDQINRFDVGVMPLPDTDWARGKCAYKLIQYMACGIPVIGSGIGANKDVVDTGCGFLASSDQDWVDAFRFYRDRPESRSRMGLSGRARVQQHYSLEQKAPVLASVIRRAVGAIS